MVLRLMPSRTPVRPPPAAGPDRVLVDASSSTRTAAAATTIRFRVPPIAGGSSCWAAGKRSASASIEWETFSARLEQSLNARRREDAAPGRYDVINCGVYGYATRQERQFYEVVGSVYEPNVVILTMTDQRQHVAARSGAAGIRPSSRQVRAACCSPVTCCNWRGMNGARPPSIIPSSLDDVVKLGEACRARGARLAVVMFRTSPLVRPWSDLVTAVSSTSAGHRYPIPRSRSGAAAGSHAGRSQGPPHRREPE